MKKIRLAFIILASSLLLTSCQTSRGCGCLKVLTENVIEWLTK